MITVTGAAGKTGRAVIRALAQRGQPVRALVRRPTQQQAVRAEGAAETVVGDMADPSALGQAVEGATALYHICPNVHPDEVAIGRAAIDAAREAKLAHMVYHSVLHPQAGAMPHHWHKLRVEEMLVAAGIPFTILQPAAYMQNLLPHWRQISADGILANPYPPEAQLSLVDLEDVAEAAAVVLTQPGHTGAIYELCGTGPKSQHEVAGILANVLGLPVRAEMTPVAEWERTAVAAGLNAYAVQTLMQMFVYYAEHGLMGNSNVLRWLLGRQPTTLTGFARRVMSHE